MPRSKSRSEPSSGLKRSREETGVPLLLYERIHSRHDQQWLLPGTPRLCLTCGLEMLRTKSGISLVRKKHTLFCFQDVLKNHTTLFIQLLTQNETVCTSLISTVFGQLHSIDDIGILKLSIQVLVQLTVQLKPGQFVHHLLKECQKELCSMPTFMGSLATMTLLGRLVDAVPSLVQILVMEYGNLVEYQMKGLMSPDERMQSSVCYLYGRLFSCPTVAEKLSVHFKEKLCPLFLTTLDKSQTKDLQINCMVFLSQLVKYDSFVSLMMNKSEAVGLNENSEIPKEESTLPLMLKKLLLSTDETVQLGSTHCMATMLAHSSLKYASALILADIPEFLFERLSSTSEILLRSLYICLSFMTEDDLLFSKFHTLYGIDSLVQSLKRNIKLNHPELLKLGLQLFKKILKRQPGQIQLFLNSALCIDANQVLKQSVGSPVMEVTVEAASAVAAFVRKDHLSSLPMPYKEVQTLIQALLDRCANFSLPPLPSGSQRSLLPGVPPDEGSGTDILYQRKILCSTIKGFRNACRLILEFQHNPSARENSFRTQRKETLKKFSEFLLRICDTHCIPIVMRYSKQAAHPALMEIFLPVLSNLFIIVPYMKEEFSKKLASSSFIRLTLMLKARFCRGQSNPVLNQACSSFLHCLCLNLFSALEKRGPPLREGLSVVSNILKCSLPQINTGGSEILALLSDSLYVDEAARQHQYCLLLLIYIAYLHEDRFLPAADLFSSVRSLLLSLEDQGQCPPPAVFRAVLYLLTICQDQGEPLEKSPLDAISKILEGISDFSLVYSHHPCMLKFFLTYPELLGHFGPRVLELWLSWETNIYEESSASSRDPALADHGDPLLRILKSSSSVLFILLDLVNSSTFEIVRKALMVLNTFLEKNEVLLMGNLVRGYFLQILQQLLVETRAASLQVSGNLPLLLSLLFLVQPKKDVHIELSDIDLKLLHQVSNLCGKCSLTDVEVLQSSFNFMYWCLSQTTPGSQKQAGTVLLACTPFLILLQKILELTWMDPFPSSTLLAPSEKKTNLLCSAWLLTASLSAHQHLGGLQVQQMITVELDRLLNILTFRKKKTALFSTSILRFLRTVLEQKCSSDLVKLVISGPGRPPSPEDTALFPLSVHQVLILVISLQNLLVEKDLLLSQAVVGCLEALLNYLQVKSPDIALLVATLPWNQFLLFTLMNAENNSFLSPEILRLMTMFMKFQSSNILSQNDIRHVLQETGKANFSELSTSTVQALYCFLLQVQSSCSLSNPGIPITIQTLLEILSERSATQPHQDLVCLGGVAVSFSHIRD